ncbi:MAG: TrkA C-terminal domain-containing protein [Candidatus Saliniplasma sp.]
MVGDTLKKALKNEDLEHEILRYEDKNVRELLTEMKDYSELIADLAYAAVVYTNKDLADEVGHIESEMDKMMYLIRLKTMLSARNIEDAKQLSGILQIASSAEKISDAAEDMVELLKYEEETKSLLPHIFDQADEMIKTLRVADASSMANKKIGDLAVESATGIRVIAIRRRGRWIYGPTGEDFIRGGDLLVVSGSEEGYQNLNEMALGKKDWRG